MKVVILAGGKGSRISYYTDKIPKPMIKIGNKPMLTHIMNLFKHYGYEDFIIAAGYKKEIITEYYKNKKEFNNIKIVNTGQDTMTGGRILKLKKFFKKNENFFMTYGDGLSLVNIDKIKNFHLNHGKICTVTAVRPPVRFGELEIKDKDVVKFEEKPQAKTGWINGGFFMLNYKIFDYISGDQILFEKEPMTKLLKNKNLKAFKYEGFWKCMDTMRDKVDLEKVMLNKNFKWKK